MITTHHLKILAAGAILSIIVSVCTLTVAFLLLVSLL